MTRAHPTRPSLETVVLHTDQPLVDRDHPAAQVGLVVAEAYKLITDVPSRLVCRVGRITPEGADHHAHVGAVDVADTPLRGRSTDRRGAARY
jgi:hypothetical protein